MISDECKPARARPVSPTPPAERKAASGDGRRSEGNIRRAARKIAAPLVVGLASLLGAGAVQAHGVVEYPVARHYKCYQDGGFWGSISAIPNAACRAAATANQNAGYSAPYMFQQWNEVATNIAAPRYNDQAAVEAEVPDGKLCAAADPRKQGLDTPHPDWYRTEVQPTNGAIEIRYYATAPHYPNFFKFYLSKPSYDGSRPLRWSDLEPLQVVGSSEDIRPTNVNGRQSYVFRVQIPSTRTGNAVLYSRWQRKDPVGEGFYNCSDIKIAGTGAPPDPFPWHEDGVFVPQGVEPKVGEAVRFRVLSQQRSGRESVDITLPITAQNQSIYVWARELATQINNSSIVRVGVRSGNQVVFDGTNIARNLVYLQNENDSHALSIITPEEPVGDVNVSLSVDNSGTAPATVNLAAQASTADGANITRVEFYNGSSLLSADTSAPYQYTWRNVGAGTYSVKAKAIDSRNRNKETAPETVTVQSDDGGGDDGGGNHPTWPAGIQAYVPGTIVRGADGNLWKCRPYPEGHWCRIEHILYHPGGPNYTQDPAAQPWIRVDN